jgi:hypothetical protein
MNSRNIEPTSALSLTEELNHDIIPIFIFPLILSTKATHELKEHGNASVQSLTLELDLNPRYSSHQRFHFLNI